MDAARLLLACTVQVGILEMWILGGGGGGFRAGGGQGPPHAWLCGRKGRAALLAPSTHVPVCPVPPQISLFVGAWWQMGSYTTVDTPFPC